VSYADLPLTVLWHNRQTEAPLSFEAQTKKLCSDFETHITKPELPVLSPKPGNPPPPWFWGSTKKLATDFEAKPGETVATSFEIKLEKTVVTDFEAKQEKAVAAGFEAKPLEIVAISFEVKPAKTVRVILRLNHSQTIDLSFEPQPRNSRSSSPRARCRSHTTSLDRPATEYPTCVTIPVFCIRSPTPATVLVAARHAASAHHKTSKRVSNKYKIKIK
jgi:hypothetical protein